MTHRTVAIAGVVAMAIALVGSALAHSFYPIECCSGYDCEPISEERVEPLAGGDYRVDGKHVVPAKEVRISPDGLYHACFPTPERLRCFWAPPPST